MEVDRDTGAKEPRRWSSAVLCTLAFVAVANLAVSGVRLASTGVAGRSSVRLLIEAAAALLLPLLALGQLRRSARQSPSVPATEQSAERPSPSSSRYKWLRRAQWVLAPVLIVGAFVSISGQWDTVADAFGQLARLHWRYVRLAVYAEAASTVAMSLLVWILLRSRGTVLALKSIIALSLATNAVSVSMPAGPALAATFSFDQLRRRGASRGTAASVLISTVVILAAALGVLLAVGVGLAGGHGPAAPFRIVVELVAAGLALTAAVLIFARRVRWPAFAPAPRALAAGFAAALGNWITDCACLAAAILAVGGQVPWSALLVVYAVGQVAGNLPITPGGVGVVEGTLSVLLVAYGLHSTTALAAVLLYRIISFWVQVPIGLATAAAMKFKLSRRALPAATEPARPAGVALPVAG